MTKGSPVALNMLLKVEPNSYRALILATDFARVHVDQHSTFTHHLSAYLYQAVHTDTL